ncbi:hypothetical protein BKP45_09680 [Anaerobacillus alkalidiazotrophicus]|uniref:UDP-N-acetylmuramyl pentapeptide phosphotransferase n=1 Tax=Anaerobacillus alkalidiazotrophicus TaxID=472963 RepID=A0A1S2M9H6_9BACI|nr:hypothetical protein BKP45_09680 [Anaerobacillus alkalidiazotrophicus]
MVIAIIINFIILFVTARLFVKLGWTVVNYKGDKVPYNIGLCVFISLFLLLVLKQSISLLALIYLATLWLTGFIDDCFGTKYPKGLKGHISLFIRKGKMSTGLLKLVGTIIISFIFATFIDDRTILEKIIIFLLLIMTPHVMNLFDTRPLRVWKVIFIHLFIFLPALFRLSVSTQVSVLLILSSFLYYEGTKRGMLGDNGATLLGGGISLGAIYHLSFFLQCILVLAYISIILITERISLTEWIESNPILSRIDRWGVS